MPSGVSTEWSRVVATTLRDYKKEAEPTLLRNMPILSMIESNGRVEKNQSGDGYDWALEKERAQAQGNSGNTALDFVAVDRYMRAFLDYRGYAVTDSMKKREFLKNRSPQALIKYYDKMGPKLFEDMERILSTELWIDGNASGNSERIHGIESIFGTDGQTLDPTTGVAEAYDAADLIFNPDDNYATLDTDLGAYGGSWDGVWPEVGGGNANSDSYDCTSPVIINYLSTALGGTTATWKDQGYSAIQFAVSATHKDSSAKGLADLCLLDRKMFRELKQELRSRERYVIESNSQLKSLGFTDNLTIDGCAVMGMFGITANTGYVLNTKHMTLVSMQKNLFEVEGPVWDTQTRCYRVVVDFLGNVIMDSPKFFAKLKFGQA